MLDVATLAQTHQSLAEQQAFVLLSPELKLTDFTPNLGTVLKLDTTGLIGQALGDVFFEFVGVETELRHRLTGKQSRYTLERVNRISAEGETLYFDFEVLRPQSLENSGFLLIVRDTTAFGRLEQALVQERNELRLAQDELARANSDLRRLDRLKSLFLSMAAHDLRAPVAIIRAYADLLLNPSGDAARLGEEARPQVQVMLVQAQWLDNLISNILDLDQIENRRLVLEYLPCTLDTIVSEMVSNLQPMASLYEQSLTLKLPGHSVLINGSPRRLRQIVQNLVGNAVKYTGVGGQIEVSLSADDTTACLSVNDNGPGISPEAQAQLFQIYYRADDSRTARVGGTGLGLYIVKTLAEAHGGAVSVVSQPGQGSSFQVCFPLLNL